MDLNLTGADAGTRVPVDGQQLHTFTPAHYWHAGDGSAEPGWQADAPTYYVRTPTQRLDARVSAYVEIERRKLPSHRQISMAIRQGLRQHAPSDQASDAEAWLDRMDAIRHGDDDPKRDEREEIADIFSDIETQVAEVHAPLRELYERRALVQSRILTMRVRCYLADASGLADTLELDGQRVTEASLDLIPPADLEAIGGEIDRLRRLSPAQRGNSGSPSRSN